MKLEQRQWTRSGGWQFSQSNQQGEANLVFIFGETNALKTQSLLQEIKRTYPNAQLFGCSTAGEIHGDRVFDDSVCTTAIHFERTTVKSASLRLFETKSSFDAGAQLIRRLDPKGLSHVFVLSVGLNVNGSELVRGLASALPVGVTMTGGLAGDKARFQETLVIGNDGLSNDQIAVVGLYGRHIKTGSASLGGWDSFGPERLVTKSKANVLYELDHNSVLQLYKSYLGDHAKELPSSALLFPLCIKSEGSQGVVRTVLGINEEDQSLIFAGDVPEGSYVQLMKANFDRLVDGAVGAAEKSRANFKAEPPELALLISCVGRKLVLKQRIEEEVEGVRDIFGSQTVLTGFYSYGEISPFTSSAKCELHNQTMTITTLIETDENAA
ncbi:MAG: FIST signal transduction protein [Bdellovibrionales bacterium]